MRYRFPVAIAFLVTSALLALNAFQISFLAGNASNIKSISLENDAGRALISNSIVAPSRYGKGISTKISSDRANTIVSSGNPENSCVRATALENDKPSLDPFVSVNENSSLIPASTNKLVTAAVVLSTFDPKSTLDTSLIAEKKSSTLSKAYIQTSGDPSFVSTSTPPVRRPSYLSPTKIHTFDDFAEQTYKAGIRSISNLVIDAKWFELDSVEEGWKEDKEQVGQISALNIDEGFAGNALASSPTQNAASILKTVFAAKGITIGNITYSTIPDSLKSQDKIISKTSSVSVKDLVSEFLKTSDNVYAEQVLAAAVHQKIGTVNKETRSKFVKDVLAELDLDSDAYVFVNGSGYSTNAKASCLFEISVIEKMKESDIDLTSLSSIAGTDGTLKLRFTDLPKELKAKTGTLDNVTALTGQLDEDVMFSFISNGAFSDEEGKNLQNKVVNSLVSFPFVSEPEFPAKFGYQ